MTFIPRNEITQSAFGEQLVANLQVHVNLRFNYSTHTRLYTDQSTNSGTFTVGSSLATVTSGTNSAGNGQMDSVNVLPYIPGLGGLVRFTAMFTTGVADSVQMAGLGDGTDGLLFAYNGTAFSILRIDGGTRNWVAQTAWNVDKMDGTGPSGMTLDPTKLNVFQIRFRWLGGGGIKFYIEDVVTTDFQLVHIIKYAGLNTTPSLQNPTLPLHLHALNEGSTTSITVKSSSMMGATEGVFENRGLLNAKGNTKNLGTTETNIITIRNKATYQSLTNRIVVSPVNLSVSTDGTKPCILRVYLDTTLGGSPSYTDISTALSVVDFDVAGTTITGGTEVFQLALGKTDAEHLDLTTLSGMLHPAQTLTITGVTTSGTSDIEADIVWKELF